MMPTSRAGAYNNHGFTMIELAMVLLVIGIAGAVVMPRIGNVLDHQQMRRSINTLRGTVRLLQARAASTKHVYRLTFDLDRQMMTVCIVDVETAECQAEQSRRLHDYTFPPAVRLLDVEDGQGTKTSEGQAITNFHPTGLAEPATIHLAGSAEQQMTLMIEPLAGNVKVLNGYVEPQAS
jgi:general secretion pathway protein H